MAAPAPSSAVFWVGKAWTAREVRAASACARVCARLERACRRAPACVSGRRLETDRHPVCLSVQVVGWRAWPLTATAAAGDEEMAALPGQAQ